MVVRENFERGEAHSPAERDHVSPIEERLHPFLRDSPLEFGVGIFTLQGFIRAAEEVAKCA